MSTSIRNRLSKLERDLAPQRQAVVVISGTDEEHDTKVAEAYASGLATEDQILVYVRRLGAEPST